ncbi:MAG TPA: outer membrane protein assembly factor BamD [Candidatus Acidoferrales bacterium]|nr:outer membrane protein assembly factor BamD [Candidatus Acidoferrales bacterium]
MKFTVNTRSLATIYLTFAGLAIILASCSSTQELIVQSAGETYRQGMLLMQDKDYTKARDKFDIVVKQYPASAYADSAQFYLAETYYDQEEYITSAFEYENVYRSYPSSKLSPDARFMIAKCYMAQAPRVQLDQQSTTKAIEAFQSFIDYYPQSPLVPQAEKEIMDLRSRVAEKYYDTAELYTAMGYYKAAVVYYDLILDQYHDSNFADKAALGKVKVLMKRHKDSDAKSALEKFYISFPNSKLREEANQLAHTLNIATGKQPDAN